MCPFCTYFPIWMKFGIRDLHLLLLAVQMVVWKAERFLSARMKLH